MARKQKVFRLSGEELPCRDSMSVLDLRKLAKTQRLAEQGDMMAGIDGLFSFIERAVLPEHHERLEELLDAIELTDFDRLEEAVGELMVAYDTESDRPTGRSKPSRSGPPTTTQSSRVVSLSPATARTDETSSTDGASAAG